MFGRCEAFLLPNWAIIAICFPGIIRCVSQAACVATTQDNFKRSVFGRRICTNIWSTNNYYIVWTSGSPLSPKAAKFEIFFFWKTPPFALITTKTSVSVVMKNCTSAPFLFKHDLCFQGKSKFALNAGKIKNNKSYNLTVIYWKPAVHPSDKYHWFYVYARPIIMRQREFSGIDIASTA